VNGVLSLYCFLIFLRGALDHRRSAVDIFNTGNHRLNFKDFSELYRAAFAEQDPERKGLLLREVQKAIDDREQPYQLLPSAAA
jgi:hypothetical protein